MERVAKQAFPLLSKVVKDKSDVRLLIDSLITRIKERYPITDNPLLDGFVIGLIHANSGYIAHFFTCTEDSSLPPSSDNTIQQLEQCVKWLINNEELLTRIVKEHKKSIKEVKEYGDYN